MHINQIDLFLVPDLLNILIWFSRYKMRGDWFTPLLWFFHIRMYHSFTFGIIFQPLTETRSCISLRETWNTRVLMRKKLQVFQIVKRIRQATNGFKMRCSGWFQRGLDARVKNQSATINSASRIAESITNCNRTLVLEPLHQSLRN